MGNIITKLEQNSESLESTNWLLSVNYYVFKAKSNEFGTMFL